MFIALRRGRGTSLIDGRVFIPVDEFDKRQWRSIAVQFVSEAEISQGAGFLLRTAVRVRVPDYALVLVSGSESCKKHDKQLTFIVRVSISYCILFNKSGILLASGSLKSGSKTTFSIGFSKSCRNTTWVALPSNT